MYQDDEIRSKVPGRLHSTTKRNNKRIHLDIQRYFFPQKNNLPFCHGTEQYMRCDRNVPRSNQTYQTMVKVYDVTLLF